MAYTLERSGFAEFDRLGDLFRRTRYLLDAVLIERDLPDGGAELLATETLPHIEDVEAGFQAWLRAGMADLAELRALVVRAGVGVGPARDAAEERAALAEAIQAGGSGAQPFTPPVARRLVALAHARLVFALLPRTPESDVRFPAGRRTYADIAVPRTPGELALRIEELERELWWTATGRAPRSAEGAYRRTYGFFDAAERLASQGFRS